MALALTTFEEIWSSYASDWNVGFDPAVQTALAPAPSTALVRCEGCGLRYFTPAVAGDPTFYETLDREMDRYAPPRWEFGVVAQRLHVSDVVADLGCADGTFLALARSRVSDVVGVDHNPAAVEATRARGLEAYANDFPSFAREHAGRFNVVCAFQTLEHLPDVAILLEPALELLRPGGRLFISVPNAERLPSYRDDALDLPPHHVSRWSMSDLATLASRYDLSDGLIAFEPPDLSHARLALRRTMDRRIRRLVGSRLAEAGAAAISKVTLTAPSHAFAIGAGFYRRNGWWGHSMVASFRAP